MKAVKQSAGILLYRYNKGVLQVLLVHPGGPFWAKKDAGAWGIPKGEFRHGEEPLAAAKREFFEETGTELEAGTSFLELSPVTLKSGKKIFCWAVKFDLDAEKIQSNFLEMEFPPKSGKIILIPEVDKAEWFSIAEAKQKANERQVGLLNELVLLLNAC